MAGTNKKLMSAVEAYFAELVRVHASGGATGERSTYGPLHGLLSAAGAALRPKVHCVLEPADLAAGHPDFALYAARQMQKGRARKGQLPECGVVEVKPLDDDAWVTATDGRATRQSGTPVAIAGAMVGPVGKRVNADDQGVVGRYRANDCGGSRLARSSLCGRPAIIEDATQLNGREPQPPNRAWPRRSKMSSPRESRPPDAAGRDRRCRRAWQCPPARLLRAGWRATA